MYAIKQSPEDFIVKELNYFVSCPGEYSVYNLKKRNISTIHAVQKIADYFRIPIKNIGYAGIKDKVAVTEQLISIKGGVRNLVLRDLELEYIGSNFEPITLGKHQGNHFIITLRDCQKIPVFEKQFLNLFGSQRLINNNAEIGKLIVKKKFLEAAKKFFKTPNGVSVKNHLIICPSDAIGALKTVSHKILLLTIHAYQSKLWNEVALLFSKVVLPPLSIPIVGFGIELDSLTKDLISKEGISPSDFIIKQIPKLSCEGSYRKLFVSVIDLKIETIDSKTIKISFSLPPGSYATEYIRQSFQDFS